jgi:hypothetical protein
MNGWMATRVQPGQVPFEAVILILLPYFVAVIAAIIYTNRQIKKIGNRVEKDSEDKEDENDKPQLGD